MARKIIEVYDKSLKKLAILQNALDVSESININAVSTMTFTLSKNDPKNEYCAAFNYIKFGDRMYRILPSEFDLTTSPTMVYECEHVIATLIDELMYGDVVIGNLGVYTTEVIEFVLSKQKTKHWKLGVCEFARQFEYGWTNESLLSALFSIPNSFVDPYIWEFDTTSHPWTVSLKKLDTSQNPQLYIRQGKNLITLKRRSDPTNICTRLYAHGYGEGINTLTFADINDGKPYIDSPQEYIDKYGLKEKLFVDRRYENKESLLEAARAMLNELQEPYVEYEVEFVEVSEQFLDKAEVGKVCMIIANEVQYKTYITGVEWDYGETTDCKLTIANKPQDVASSVADLADRQRIEMTYAQGATQLYAQSLQANCDSDNGAEMQFYIPAEMKIVNSVQVKIKMSRFRAYSQATSTTDKSTQTSSSGGRSTQTSSSGGGGSTTSGAGGGGITTSGDSGVDVTWGDRETTVASGHSHYVRVTTGHKHEIELPQHSHRVTISSHSHNVSIPAHTHNVDIPGHNHEITPGIYFFGSAKNFKLYVNNVLRGSFSSSDAEVDITQYLVNDQGIISRGTWHSVNIVPDDLAYICLDMYVQGFVQSRGDNTV